MKPKRILYVHNAGWIAGGNRALLDLFDCLDPARFIPYSILPAPGPLEDELRARRIPYEIVDIDSAFSAGYRGAAWAVARLAIIMVRRRIALLHANDTRCYRHASAAAAAIGIPRVCHLQYPTARGSLRWAFAIKPHVAIACSKSIARDLEIPEMKCIAIAAVQNAVDLDKYVPPTSLTASRRKLDLHDHSHIVTIVGGVSERKGHRYFLEMAKALLPTYSRAAFVVVGDDFEGRGAYRIAMERYARLLGVDGNVRFVGHRDDVVDWMAASDLIVLPSLAEGLPLSLAEAHGCGKPIVATNVDGVPEIVDDGVSGILVPPHDVPELTRAVDRLLGDPLLRERMGQAGRARAERYFSRRAHARAIQEIYMRLLDPASDGHQPSFVPSNAHLDRT